MCNALEAAAGRLCDAALDAAAQRTRNYIVDSKIDMIIMV
jgi:hypothetical protein